MCILAIYILQNLIKNNEKQMLEMQLETVTIVGTGKSIGFIVC